MLKLSISLPNSTQITLESEEPALIHEVLLLVLRNGVAVDAAPQSVPAPPPNGHHTAAEISNDVTPPAPPAPSPAPSYPPPNGVAAAHPPANGASPPTPVSPAAPPADGYPAPTAIAPVPHPAPAAAGHAAPSPLPAPAATGHATPSPHPAPAAAGHAAPPPHPAPAAAGHAAPPPHPAPAAAGHATPSPHPTPAATGYAAPSPHPTPAAAGYTTPSPHPAPATAGYTAPLAPPAGFAAPALPPGDADDDGLLLESQPQAALDDFVAFCQSVNPMGDMRRVVVAAEGAGRFFRAEGVNADELGELFDLAGWRRANSFTQTLRNAARSKFGWLERIPGRSGRYAATDLGRSVTLGG